ncbi:hypothetical protein SKAU_G00044160 [Synaphobranchus kaupii]|uniref:Uncharacterized protein n=1 Tax=Synaphobranchus kaupii TaxID=118154 RepID=A0A9Q1G2J0_SYNKA|nr:hypothetical protein SKAU_G00044160 [Synaphobranchus kaupii]
MAASLPSSTYCCKKQAPANAPHPPRSHSLEFSQVHQALCDTRSSVDLSTVPSGGREREQRPPQTPSPLADPLSHHDRSGPQRSFQAGACFNSAFRVQFCGGVAGEDAAEVVKSRRSCSALSRCGGCGEGEIAQSSVHLRQQGGLHCLCVALVSEVLREPHLSVM